MGGKVSGRLKPVNSRHDQHSNNSVYYNIKSDTVLLIHISLASFTAILAQSVKPAGVEIMVTLRGNAKKDIRVSQKDGHFMPKKRRIDLFVEYRGIYIQYLGTSVCAGTTVGLGTTLLKDIKDNQIAG